MRTIDRKPVDACLRAMVASLLLASSALGQGPSQVTFVDLGGGCSAAPCGSQDTLAGWGFNAGPCGAQYVSLCADTSVPIGPLSGGSFLVLGASIAAIDLSALSPGCVLLPSPDVISQGTGGCGTCAGAMGCGFSGSCFSGNLVAATFSIPCDPSLVGATAFAQVSQVFLGSPPGLRLSNALAVTFS